MGMTRVRALWRSTPPAGITKRLVALVANDRIGLGLRAGEIQALLGENRAGKRTLMNVLYSPLKPDQGEILVGGEPVVFRSSADAFARHRHGPPAHN
jgi:ABC-type uncharacterized transport system ATPase subunit